MAGKSVADTTKPFLIYPRGMQPEDYLTVMCESLWGYKLRDAFDWAKAQNIPPGQVHAVLSMIVNNLIGKDVDLSIFTKDINIIYDELHAGRAVMTSGQFTPAGHAVCVSGMRYDENTNIVSHILIDDPYGDYFSGYTNQNGNGIWFPLDKFLELWSGNIHKYVGG